MANTIYANLLVCLLSMAMTSLLIFMSRIRPSSDSDFGNEKKKCDTNISNLKCHLDCAIFGWICKFSILAKYTFPGISISIGTDQWSCVIRFFSLIGHSPHHMHLSWEIPHQVFLTFKSTRSFSFSPSLTLSLSFFLSQSFSSLPFRLPLISAFPPTILTGADLI